MAITGILRLPPRPDDAPAALSVTGLRRAACTCIGVSMKKLVAHLTCLVLSHVIARVIGHVRDLRVLSLLPGSLRVGIGAGV